MPLPADVNRVALAFFIADTRPDLSGRLNSVDPSPVPYVVPINANNVA
jgi:hypothetical protein